MMASMAAFTFNDAILKVMAGQIPLFQLLFLRGALTSVAVALICWRMDVFGAQIPRRDRWLIALRTTSEVAAAYFLLTALFNMPIADVTAILQALPLTIALAAALLFSEPLGWRRLTAILVGFVGVLLIVQPGGDGFSIYALYGLAAVACVTVRDLTTRRLSRGIPSMLVTLFTSMAVMTVFGLASLGAPWVPMSGREIALTVGSAFCVIGGYLFSVMVMRVGEISFVAPFRYTALIWALLLGWFVFGEWPAPLTMLGAAIVVGSGLFTLYREAKLARRKSA